MAGAAAGRARVAGRVGKCRGRTGKGAWARTGKGAWARTARARGAGGRAGLEPRQRGGGPGYPGRRQQRRQPEHPLGTAVREGGLRGTAATDRFRARAGEGSWPVTGRPPPWSRLLAASGDVVAGGQRPCDCQRGLAADAGAIPSERRVPRPIGQVNPCPRARARASTLRRDPPVAPQSGTEPAAQRPVRLPIAHLAPRPLSRWARLVIRASERDGRHPWAADRPQWPLRTHPSGHHSGGSGAGGVQDDVDR